MSGLVDRVRVALADEKNVREKNTFGGITFMVRGHMCISAGESRIMCRIGEEDASAAIGSHRARAVVMRGREIRHYVYVDAPSLGTRKQIDRWLQMALAYNRALPAR